MSTNLSKDINCMPMISLVYLADMLTLILYLYQRCKQSGDEGLLCLWTHAYASTHQKKVQASGDNMTEDNINSLLTTLDQLGKHYSSTSGCSSIGSHHHIVAANNTPTSVSIDKISDWENGNTLFHKCVLGLIYHLGRLMVEQYTVLRCNKYY